MFYTHLFFGSLFSLFFTLNTLIVNVEQYLPGYKLILCTLRSVFGVNHEQHVWKSSPEICSVGVMVSRTLRCVNIHAFGTVAFDHCFTRDITKTQWQHWL